LKCLSEKVNHMMITYFKIYFTNDEVNFELFTLLPLLLSQVTSFKTTQKSPSMPLKNKLLMVLFQLKNTIKGRWAEPRSNNYKLGLAFQKPYLAYSLPSVIEFLSKARAATKNSDNG